VKRPFDFSPFMASLYGFAFTQDNRMPVIARDNVRGGSSIKAVKSAVYSAEASYWKPELRDPIYSGWAAADDPKYIAMFDPSNEWDLDEYVGEYLDERDSNDPCGNILYYVPAVSPYYRETPMHELPVYTYGRAVCLKALPQLESRFCVFHIYPNGSVLYTVNKGVGYIEGRKTISDLFWDAETDTVKIKVYMCDREGGEFVEDIPSEDRLWKKPLSTCSEFFHSIYYSKLIYGSISEDDFSKIGGGSERHKRNMLLEVFTMTIDKLLCNGEPKLEGEHEVVRGRLHTATEYPHPEDAFDIWSKAGGYGLASRVELSVYDCDRLANIRNRTLSVVFR